MRTLEELVRGSRSTDNLPEFLDNAITEIQRELGSKNPKVKAVALQKLIYIQLHRPGGVYDIGSFHSTEAISSKEFSVQHIGYLFATQTFTKDRDIVLLLAHQLQNHFKARNKFLAGEAFNFLGIVCTKDLAVSLSGIVITSLSSFDPFIKKRALSALHNIFINYPEAVPQAYSKMKEKLLDPGIELAILNLLAEIVPITPKSYIRLAPTVYKILTEPPSTLAAIKALQILTAMYSAEPRLGKKLAGPLATILNDVNEDMALVYEAIRVVFEAFPTKKNLVTLAAGRTRDLVSSNIKNEKLLGLRLFNMIRETHKKAISNNRDVIVECLMDEDVKIKIASLELLSTMANAKNIVDIIEKLIENVISLSEEQARDGDGNTLMEIKFVESIVYKVIELCTHNNYERIKDFDWYLDKLIQASTILDEAYTGLISKDLYEHISDSILDVLIRVEQLRDYGVERFIEIISAQKNYTKRIGAGDRKILYVAAFCLGEYCDSILEENIYRTVEYLLLPRVGKLEEETQSVFVSAALKISAYTMSLREYPDTESVFNVLDENLKHFTSSPFLEVQERACVASELSKVIRVSEEDLYSTIFGTDLKPVVPGLQDTIKVPEGLDLDAWIHDDFFVTDDFSEDSDGFSFLDGDGSHGRRRGERDSVYYLGKKKGKKKKKKKSKIKTKKLEVPKGIDLDKEIASVSEYKRKTGARRARKNRTFKVKTFDIDKEENRPKRKTESKRMRKGESQMAQALAGVDFENPDVPRITEEVVKEKRERPPSRDIVQEFNPEVYKTNDILVTCEISVDAVRMFSLKFTATARHYRKLKLFRIGAGKVSSLKLVNIARDEKKHQTTLTFKVVGKDFNSEKLAFMINYQIENMKKSAKAKFFVHLSQWDLMFRNPEMDKDELVEVLKNADPAFTSEMDTIKLGRESGLKSLTVLLGKLTKGNGDRFHVVEKTKKMASLYGKTVMGYHVILIAKRLTRTDFVIDIKSNMKGLSKQVMRSLKI